MTATSRGEFLAGGARGGLALVVGGALVAAAPGAALGQDVGGDAAIAALAATAELLAVDFYGRAIDRGGFEGDQLVYLEAARENERDHYDRLAEVLGDRAPAGLAFRYPAGTFATRAGIVAAGVALEQAFVGAYLGAVSRLRSVELKGVAALVGANEAQHLATLERLGAGRLTPSPSLPPALTAAQARAALTPFLA